MAKVIEHKKDALAPVGTNAQDSKLALIWPSLAGSVFCRDVERVDHCVAAAESPPALRLCKNPTSV